MEILTGMVALMKPLDVVKSIEKYIEDKDAMEIIVHLIANIDNVENIFRLERHIQSVAELERDDL